MKTIAASAIIALLGVGTSFAATPQPRLHLVDATPLTVTGSAFRPHERVRVVYKADQTWTRQVVATARGTFTARFSVRLDLCARRVIYAIGTSGSKAYLRFPPPACPPPVAP